MSTRSTISVWEDGEGFHLYRHSDGYPYGEHGVLHGLRQAFPFAWALPRFEADDFAAGIVAAWKQGGGNIRLTSGRDAHGDTEFHYDVSKLANQSALYVKVWVPVDEYGKGRSWLPLIGARVTADRVKLLPLKKADQALLDARGGSEAWADDLKRLWEQEEYGPVATGRQAEDEAPAVAMEVASPGGQTLEQMVLVAVESVLRRDRDGVILGRIADLAASRARQQMAERLQALL